MRLLLRRALIAAALALLPLAAHAQRVPVYQSGSMAPGDLSKFWTNGLVGSAGGLLGDTNGKGVNPFAVTDSVGLGVCADSAATTGAYNAFCLGHDTNGNALLTVDSYGGLANKTAYFRLNGTLYQFPFTLSGGVLGPASSTVNHVACWNNTTGSLLLDCGIQITGPGTSTANHLVLWKDATGAPLSDGGPARLSATTLPTPGNLYVNGSGSDSNDCEAAVVGSGHGPCATIGHTLAVALGYDAAGKDFDINIAAGTYNENVAISGPAVGTAGNAAFVNRASLPMIVLVGAGSGLTTIANVGVVSGVSYCYGVLVSNGGVIGLKGLTITANSTAGSCTQSDLYAQLGGRIYIDSDVTLGAANGNLITEEEHGAVYVAPGTGGTLTLAGNAGGDGIDIDSGSIFEADTTVAISGTPAFTGGYLFAAAQNSVIKLAGSPGVTSAATITGARFSVTDNSVLYAPHPPATWPGTLGIADLGGRYHGTDDAACVGGAAGCINTTAPTGIGTGGTVVASSVIGEYSGTLKITAGTSAAISGTVSVGFAYILNNAVCTAVQSNGTGAWALSAVVAPAAVSSTGITFNWANNTTALTSGNTYFITYVCATAQ